MNFNPALGLLFLHGYVATPTGVANLTHATTPTPSTTPGLATNPREAAHLDLDDCIAC